MILGINDHISLTIKEVEPFISSFTYPVFISDKYGRPDQIGSCVCIQKGEKSFLITAAHVLKNIREVKSNFIIANDNSFLDVVGPAMASNIQLEGKKVDNFDIAAIHLSPSFLEQNKINVLPERYINFRNTFYENTLYIIHGYPNSKNKQIKSLDKTNKIFKAHAYSYAGVKCEKPNWDKFNKNDNRHLCLSYNKVIGKEKPEIPPSPRGISGGGLWLVPNTLNPSAVFLGGIFIEYHKSHEVSFSTRIDKVFNFLDLL